MRRLSRFFSALIINTIPGIIEDETEPDLWEEFKKGIRR
jgi:hypothetical protein